jgi:hypothetical protein
MPTREGLKKAAQASGVLSFISALVAALLKASTLNVVVIGATALGLVLVVVIGAYKLLDRFLRHIEKMNGVDPAREGGRATDARKQQLHPVPADDPIASGP